MPTASWTLLVDALNTFISDEAHPYAFALAAAQFRDAAPTLDVTDEKGKYRWEQFQAFVGSPRCDWRAPPEEIGKPLPTPEAPKEVEGWQWALFNKTVMDIHAFCQNGHEWR